MIVKKPITEMLDSCNPVWRVLARLKPGVRIFDRKRECYGKVNKIEIYKKIGSERLPFCVLIEFTNRPGVGYSIDCRDSYYSVGDIKILDDRKKVK